jgi:peroxiredoxin Q/BCP
MTLKKTSTKKNIAKKIAKKAIKKAAPKKAVQKKKVAAQVKKAAPKKTVQKKAAVSAKKKAAVKTSGPLRVGSVAPNFSLPSTAGGMITLSEFRGKRVVLYFYPKDMTSGCTIEAHEFSELAKTFASKKVFVFGVSPDSIESHKKFIEKDAITFPLLADVGHKAAEAYGAWVEKSMYGRAYMGIERSTFVIGPDGKLEQVYRQVKAEGHAVCVLEDLKK